MSDLRISFPRWWIEQARDQLQGSLPSGKLGDWAFIFREQLSDALARTDDAAVAAYNAALAASVKGKS